MKPPLTELQRHAFESEFTSICDDEGVTPGVPLVWNSFTETPYSDDIAKKFSLKGKDRYVTLLNKLNDRQL